MRSRGFLGFSERGGSGVRGGLGRGDEREDEGGTLLSEAGGKTGQTLSWEVAASRGGNLVSGDRQRPRERSWLRFRRGQ